MSARLAACFARLRSEGRAGLVAYVMAGDPDPEVSFEILKALPAAGADVIEIGAPFSDPMADGPSIQRAGLRALKAGSSLRLALDLAARFRAFDAETPLILMGYCNPIEAMGAGGFAEAAAAAGLDGALIVDLPPEEDATARAALADQALALIRMATPTTDATRLPIVLDGASGFLYYVSVAGVTGVKAADVDAASAAVRRLQAHTRLPIAVGFGVRTPDQAAAVARFADAVVVGSALVDAVAAATAEGRPQDAPAAVAALAGELSRAIAGARVSASGATT